MTFEDLGIVLYGKSKQQKTLCPKCSHTRNNSTERCLSVNTEDGTYNCHHCGFSGSILDNYTKVSPWGESVSDGAFTKFFEHRGFKKTTITGLGISYGFEWLPQTSKKEICIGFPYYYKGKLVNYKFRDENKNFKLVSGARLVPYNFDNALNRLKARETKRLYIVEGEMDAIAFHEAGYDVISVPNGASPKVNNLAWLETVFDDIIEIKGLEIVIATDMDEPGKKLRVDIQSRLVNHFRLYYAEFGDCKDGNEYYLKNGNLKLELHELKKPSIYKVSDGIAKIQYYAEHGYPKGNNVMGMSLYTTHKKEFTLMTGIPNHGKTSMTLNMAVSEILDFGEKVGIMSLEKSPDILIARAIEIYIGKPINRMSPADLNQAKDLLEENLIVNRPVSAVTEDLLFDEIEYMIGKYGITRFILDPYSHVQLKNKKDKNDAIGEFLVRYSEHCKICDYHTTMVAHPRKMDKVGGTYQVPKAYDVSGSHHFYNVPDNILSFYRHDMFELHVLKIREHFVGSPGVVMFDGNKDTGVFTKTQELTPDEFSSGF